jgi:hypothetical protein
VTRFFTSRPRPPDSLAEASLRASLGLPRLGNPEPEPARLTKIADGALRAARVAAPPEAAFGWLLSPRAVSFLLAVAAMGLVVGVVGWPMGAVAAQAGISGLLDLPLAAAIEAGP